MRGAVEKYFGVGSLRRHGYRGGFDFCNSAERYDSAMVLRVTIESKTNKNCAVQSSTRKKNSDEQMTNYRRHRLYSCYEISKNYLLTAYLPSLFLAQLSSTTVMPCSFHFVIPRFRGSYNTTIWKTAGLF